MAELQSGLNKPTPIVDHPLIEFRQKYENGETLVKRGLKATPMVLKKYGISEREVMSFTNHEDHMRALTAFHFHPIFQNLNVSHIWKLIMKARNWQRLSVTSLLLKFVRDGRNGG